MRLVKLTFITVKASILGNFLFILVRNNYLLQPHSPNNSPPTAVDPQTLGAWGKYHPAYNVRCLGNFGILSN